MKSVNFLFVVAAIQIWSINGENVEELKDILNKMRDLADKLKGSALTYRENLLAERAAHIKQERQGLYKNALEVKNVERKETGDLVAKLKKDVAKEILVAALDEKMKVAVDKKIEEFEQLFQGFKDEVKTKRFKFEDRIKEINKKRDDVKNLDNWVKTKKDELEKATMGDNAVIRLRSELNLIQRQVQLQQFNEEEKVRSDGNSGIKQIRTSNVGAKNYHSNTHNGNQFASIHDHADNMRTVGMGEFIAVLNGVEFRTRHNDYSLKKPASNTEEFHAVEDIKFPDVPPEVLNAGSVDEQITEMREWFKAFQTQDRTKRDYRKYFKPILCYLEGAWTTKESDDIEEPFQSDRHFIDARNYADLQDKIHFTSYSGGKSRSENLAHLPTTIMDFMKNGTPIFAQWNYRILCHELEKDFPKKYFKVVLDPASQKLTGSNDTQYELSKAARFDIEGIHFNGHRSEQAMFYNLLDSLMEEIPGKNNYGARIMDSGFDAAILSARPGRVGKPLNGANYHRPYKLSGKDAMGVDSAARGYADRFYLALTTQQKISGPTYRKNIKTADGVKVREVKEKASYAVPLEIIYLTPLAKWNPYNLVHAEKDADVNGKGTFVSPYSSTSPEKFFRTPAKFFKSTNKQDDVYILPDGVSEPAAVHASGIRVLLPDIDGIDGPIRQRFPIMPIYGEGSSVWKKLNALEDSIAFRSIIASNVKHFATGVSNSAVTTKHTHVITVLKADLHLLKTGEKKEIEVTTERGNSHVHIVKLRMENGKLIIATCDSSPNRSDLSDVVCWDNHPEALNTTPDE